MDGHTSVQVVPAPWCHDWIKHECDITEQPFLLKNTRWIGHVTKMVKSQQLMNKPDRFDSLYLQVREDKRNTISTVV